MTSPHEEPASAEIREEEESADRFMTNAVVQSQDSADIGSRLEVAQQLDAVGLNAIAIRADGTKRPAGLWKRSQTNRTDPALFPALFAPTSAFGVGIVTGVISGDVEMLELEGRAMDLLPVLLEAIEEAGLTNVWLALWNGLREESPSRGVHLFARITGGAVRGNLTLAYEAPREGSDEQHGEKLAETRGEGGIVVMAPSGGSVHPSGRSWTRVAGSPSTIPEITAEDRDALYEIIRTTLDASGVVRPLTGGSVASNAVAPISTAAALALLPDGPLDAAYAPVLARVTPTGMSHEDLLDATRALAKTAVLERRSGGREAYALARAIYTRAPDASWGTKTAGQYGQAFDAALAGSAALWAERRAALDEEQALDREMHEMFGPASRTAPQQSERVSEPSTAVADPLDDPAFAGLRPGARDRAEWLLNDRDGRAALRRYDGPGVDLRSLLVTADQIDEIPDAQPLIDGVLPLGAVGFLVGESGLGKSALTLHAALCVATGRPWHGHAAEQRNVLVVTAEGAGGLRRRVEAISRRYGLPAAGDRLHLLPYGPDLSDTRQAELLAEICRDHAIGLVVLDTLNATAGELDENSAGDMGRYVARARALVAEQGGTVLIVHHTGLTEKDRMRGSSALYAAADVVLAMKGAPESWTLKVAKDKEGPRRDLGAFRTVGVHGGVVAEMVRAASALFDRAPEQPVVRAIREYVAEHDGVTKTAAVAALASAHQRNAVDRAVSSMVEDGSLVVERRPGSTGQYLHVASGEEGGE